MKYLLLMLLFACGTERTTINQNPPATVEAYTFAELQATCSKCHNTSAPAIPLNDEAAFKASPKIRAEIASGDMPPTTGSFQKAKALAFLDGKKPVKSGPTKEY